VVRLPERIAQRRLTLLQHPERRIEAPQQAVGFFHRRYEGVAQAQVDDQSPREAPVILNVPRQVHPVENALVGADELRSPRRISREEVFQGCGTRDCGSCFALEIDPAPRIVDVDIGLDVRVLDAELQSVLTSQIREAVLEIVIWIDELQGTAAPRA
jgi:hypothetical protein